jgi:hypothetical protein
MRVLFTGMASSHCKKPDNVTFFGVLSDVVSEFAEVVWDSPKLSWTKKDLDKFDLVVFGFTPPTALSANKIYGAMHLLGLMFHSPKLRLVVDSSQVWQYKNSIQAVKRDVSTLFSKFYSRRYDYRRAQSEDSRKYIDLAAEHMGSDVWPKIYYPELPWSNKSEVGKSLGFGSVENMIGVNLDSFLLLPEPQGGSERTNFWSVSNAKGSWYGTVKQSLRATSLDMLDISSKSFKDDSSVLSTIRSSLGLIVPPQERTTGTWWSYRYIQGMNSNTPIVTLWQSSQKLGESWAYLAYQIEDMSAGQRVAVAQNQLELYKKAIPTKDEIINLLRNDMVDSKKERI